MAETTTRSAPAEESVSIQLPALEASILYLRPSLRIHLLSALTDLGIFVSESVSVAPAALTVARVSANADLLVLVCDDSPEHCAVISGVRPEAAVVVAIVPPRSSQPKIMAAGAFVCCNDETSRTALLVALTSAATHSRRIRLAREAGEAMLFGDVLFQTNPPVLMREGSAVALSRSEGRVLATLVAAHGEPVGKHLLGDQGEQAINPANLKTIVMRLRRKAARLGGDPVMLGSVRGFGYVLRG
ncbi:MAG TPA: winged helix-turn-helix domain-containing protein [Gemmataceae bacterium]|nr:winged helix-turn-helix domain-containing protein [Gemmataceae bacterium]